MPHSAHGRLKSQKAAFPLGEEVRISRLGLKPAPRSEKADIGSTENSTDIRRIKTSWLRPRAHAPSTCASSAEKSAPLAHSPMYFFYRNYWFQTKNALSDFLGAQGFRTALPGHKSIGAVGGRYLVVHFSAIPPSERPGIAASLAIFSRTIEHWFQQTEVVQSHLLYRAGFETKFAVRVLR